MKKYRWLGSLLATSALVMTCTISRNPQTAQTDPSAAPAGADYSQKPVVNPIANPVPLSPASAAFVAGHYRPFDDSGPFRLHRPVTARD